MNDDSNSDKPFSLAHISGGIWRVPDVNTQPRAVLRRWQVYEVEGASHHLVGYCDKYREGRATSRLEAFDAKSGVARTQSGRLYELAGEPGIDGDAAYVWSCWCLRNGITDIKTVTEDFEAAMLAARSEAP